MRCAQTGGESVSRPVYFFIPGKFFYGLPQYPLGFSTTISRVFKTSRGVCGVQGLASIFFLKMSWLQRGVGPKAGFKGFFLVFEAFLRHLRALLWPYRHI